MTHEEKAQAIENKAEKLFNDWICSNNRPALESSAKALQSEVAKLRILAIGLARSQRKPVMSRLASASVLLNNMEESPMSRIW